MEGLLCRTLEEVEQKAWSSEEYAVDSDALFLSVR